MATSILSLGALPSRFLKRIAWVVVLLAFAGCGGDGAATDGAPPKPEPLSTGEQAEVRDALVEIPPTAGS
jgi:hypothetical protein